MKKGFTLLEVLIVVVIAVSVAVFAVPAYKKTQDKNRYLAAQGVLMDLGNGLRTLQSEGYAFPSSAQQVTYSNMNGTLAADALISSSNYQRALVARKYMSPIPFDNTSTSIYKGYKFYACPVNTASSSNCCNKNAGVVACMEDSTLQTVANSPTAGQYYRATFLRSGSIKRIPKN